MGYDSCWFYPPLDASQNLPPNSISPQIHVGPAVKVGQPFLLLPYSLPKEGGGKKERKHTIAKGTRERQEKHCPTSRSGDGPPPASPL